LIITELLKGRLNRGLVPNLYFWRDHTGREVDCLAEWGGKLHAIEIKMTSTFSGELLTGIKFFTALAPESKSFFVYNGEFETTFQGTQIVPLTKLNSIF
jgi:predicted AAA+ superfamily ATPase